MKVLVAHNRYRSDAPSGENQVVDAEIDGLRDAGVEVIPYLRSSDEIHQMGLARRATVPAQPIHASRAQRDLDGLIVRERPDVVHVHNVFPLISWSVVRTARRRGVPVVATVHNHRHSCMRGSYHRDGHPCQLCRGLTLPWPAVQHGCYRDSRLQSIPMAAAFALHRGDQRAVDRYIALTPAGAASILESGLATPDQVVVRPNSVPDPGPAGPPGSGLVFIGRLTQDKGVPLLLAAWEKSGQAFGRLTLVGSGPEQVAAEDVASRVGSGIVVTGQLTPREVGEILRGCAAVVVPSLAPEALPLVVLEAFAHGRSVVTLSTSGLGDVVDDAVGWISAPAPDALAETLRQAAAGDLVTRGSAARATYEGRFAPDVVMRAQLDIYRSVIADRSGSR